MSVKEWTLLVSVMEPIVPLLVSEIYKIGILLPQLRPVISPNKGFLLHTTVSPKFDFSGEKTKYFVS